MADAKAKIVISGEDRTKGAIEQAKRNIAGLRTSVDDLVLPFRNIGAIVAGLGAGIAAISIKNVIDTADQLGKLSQRTGVAVEDLSALKYAGELADVSLEDLGEGLKRLNLSIAEAAAGSKEQVAAFAAMGVSFKNADGSVRKVDDVLGDVADKFASYADGANKVALANAIGGKSFEAWIPLLNQGRQGLVDARAELEKFGGVMTGELARKSEEFNDNLTRLGAAAQSLKIQLASGLIGTLADLSTQFAQAASSGTLFEKLLERVKDVLSGRATARATGIDPFGFHSEDYVVNLKSAENEVDRIRRKIQEAQNAVAGDSTSSVLRSQLPQLNAQLAEAEKRLQGLRAGGGRGSINPPLVSPPKEETVKKPQAPTIVIPKKTPTLKLPKITDEEREAKRAARAYDDLIASINSRISIGQEEIATGERVSEAQRFALDVVGSLAEAELKLGEAQKQGITAALEKYLALDQANQAQKDLLDAQQKTAAISRSELDKLYEEVDARIQANESLRAHVEEIGLTEKQLEDLTIARLEDVLATKAQELSNRLSASGYDDAAEAMERNIRLLRQEIDLRKEAGAKTSAIGTDPVKGAKDAIDDYLAHVRLAGDNTRLAVGQSIALLEDGLTEFVSTGKLDFKGLIDFMIAEALRLMVIKPLLNSIFSGEGVQNLLSLGASSFAGLGGGAGNYNFGGGFAKGGLLGAGKWGIAGEEGPELIKGPAEVIPAGKFGGTQITNVYNVAAGVTRNEVLAALQTQAAVTEARVMQRMKSAGAVF